MVLSLPALRGHIHTESSGLVREERREYTVDAAGTLCFLTARQAAVALTARPDVATRPASAYTFPWGCFSRYYADKAALYEGGSLHFSLSILTSNPTLI